MNDKCRQKGQKKRNAEYGFFFKKRYQCFHTNLRKQPLLYIRSGDYAIFCWQKIFPETILRMKKIPAGRNAEIMAFAGRDSAVTFRLCCRSAAGAGIFPGWPVRRGCAALIYSHPALPGPGRLGKG